MQLNIIEFELYYNIHMNIQHENINDANYIKLKEI